MLKSLRDPFPMKVEEGKWMTPARWPSRGITYTRSRGQFVEPTAEAALILRDRLLLAAEICRRIVQLWEGKASTSKEYSLIHADTINYLNAAGMPAHLHETVWATGRRISQACQKTLRERQSLDPIRASVQGLLPTALATRLRCGHLTGLPLTHNGNIWQVEEKIHVRSQEPLAEGLNRSLIAYGEAALIGGSWAMRFVQTQGTERT